MQNIQKGIYRHYKGQLYQVFGVARHSETEELMVVYQCLYGEYQLWLRPFDMFIENVTLDNGNVVPRFEFIQENF
ncbi:DUF1653 domain-containing protein [Acinetobacter puyangensis]|uniref:DUF1653 domain-containing protein n=1 Tax=Acinetobacter puyangensis TaxID=1096779 RepID=A0A240E9N2_9GAMM|nr:DUF1653 domain-containing protein [Acinetobacter puyangensis]SNX44909.1 Protein of unknown function [Acinetobacter puyangensis]